MASGRPSSKPESDSPSLSGSFPLRSHAVRVWTNGKTHLVMDARGLAIYAPGKPDPVLLNGIYSTEDLQRAVKEAVSALAINR